MSDFLQTGASATLHRLGRPNVQRLEQELGKFSEETPIDLVLPCHIKELGTHALKLIVRELKSLTYPLAGEFSRDVDLVRRLRIPYDWALEVGTLAEVFRNTAPRAICQSALCENYDHKPQELHRVMRRKG